VKLLLTYSVEIDAANVLPQLFSVSRAPKSRLQQGVVSTPMFVFRRDSDTLAFSTATPQS
jgi:hypothetical protein